MDSEPADTTKKKNKKKQKQKQKKKRKIQCVESGRILGHDPWLRNHSPSRNIFNLKLSLTKNENYT